jgi:hypothetical protein
VFEDRMQKKKLGRENEKARGEWRKLRNEELHDRHSSTNEPIFSVIKVRRIKWVEGRGVYGVWWGKTEGNRQLGRPGKVG